MGTSGPQQVLERLHAAINAHDLEAFTANFDPGYRSEQPAHPDRAFTGSDQVRENWRAMFAGVPDFHADVIASAIAGDTLWTEWRWTGTPQDGSELDVRGVTLFGVEEDRI